MTTDIRNSYRYAQFRKDGYWYPVKMLDTDGSRILVEIIRPRRGRRPQKWIWADRLSLQRPALS